MEGGECGGACGSECYSRRVAAIRREIGADVLSPELRRDDGGGTRGMAHGDGSVSDFARGSLLRGARGFEMGERDWGGGFGPGVAGGWHCRAGGLECG